MALVDDIAAIDANPDLTDDQKRSQKYKVKGDALVIAINKVVGQTITRGIYTVLISEPVYYDEGMKALAVPRLEITKDGVPVSLSLPIYFRNPPILARFGGGQVREDLDEVAMQIITDLAG